jgi:hypothetical protein
MKFRNVTAQILSVQGRSVSPGQIVDINESVGRSVSGLVPVPQQTQVLTEAPLGEYIVDKEKKNG